jgi:hypothetical protein
LVERNELEDDVELDNEEDDLDIVEIYYEASSV